MSKSVFVVYSGQDTDFEENSVEALEGCDPIGFTDKDDAIQTFKNDIQERLVTKNRGHYVIEVKDVDDNEVSDYLDDEKIVEIFKNKFGGKEVEVVDSWEVSLDSWLPEALGSEDPDEMPEGAEITDDGWIYTESNANPY